MIVSLHESLCFVLFQCRFIQFSKNKYESTRKKALPPEGEPSKLNAKRQLQGPKVLNSDIILRKEVIQPHLPIRLPCYDFTPIICPTFGGWLLTVTSPTSGVTNSRGVTGGVYKARERIHRGMLIHDY